MNLNGEEQKERDELIGVLSEMHLDKTFSLDRLCGDSFHRFDKTHPRFNKLPSLQPRLFDLVKDQLPRESQGGKMRKGFTLIELLVVVAIIGILLALIIPAIQMILGVGDEVVGQVTLRQVSQGEYGPDYWIELTQEDGTKITYSTSRSVFGKMQMNEWYRVKACHNDKITKFLEHLPSEPVAQPTAILPQPSPPETVDEPKVETESFPQGSPI